MRKDRERNNKENIKGREEKTPIFPHTNFRLHIFLVSSTHIMSYTSPSTTSSILRLHGLSLHAAAVHHILSLNPPTHTLTNTLPPSPTHSLAHPLTTSLEQFLARSFMVNCIFFSKSHSQSSILPAFKVHRFSKVQQEEKRKES